MSRTVAQAFRELPGKQEVFDSMRRHDLLVSIERLLLVEIDKVAHGAGDAEEPIVVTVWINERDYEWADETYTENTDMKVFFGFGADDPDCDVTVCVAWVCEENVAKPSDKHGARIRVTLTRRTPEPEPAPMEEGVECRAGGGSGGPRPRLRSPLTRSCCERIMVRTGGASCLSAGRTREDSAP